MLSGSERSARTRNYSLKRSSWRSCRSARQTRRCGASSWPRRPASCSTTTSSASSCLPRAPRWRASSQPHRPSAPRSLRARFLTARSRSWPWSRSVVPTGRLRTSSTSPKAQLRRISHRPFENSMHALGPKQSTESWIPRARMAVPSLKSQAPPPPPLVELSAPDTATHDPSIVIVTHNGRDLAIETIESAQEASDGISVEWVIVDCGSSDDTPDAIEARWPEIDVLRLQNVGFAAGNNAGFAVARGRYLLALNPDTLVRWGQFKDLVDAMDARPQVGASSVIQERVDGSFQSIRRDPSVTRALSEALCLHRLPGFSSLQERVVDQFAYNEELEADWLVGAVLMLRREALGDVGVFDERFFLYSEEADLCLRLRDAGWHVRHLPVMRILHYCGVPNPRLAAQASFSRLAYAANHFGTMRALLYRSAIAANHSSRVIGLALTGSRDRVSCELQAL